jgi:hypothetical protein
LARIDGITARRWGMKKRVLLAAVVCGVLAVSGATGADFTHRAGFGFNYWWSIGDQDLDSTANDITENGYSLALKYQLLPADLWRIEAALEIFEDKYGGYRGDVFAPELYALVGRDYYGGVGIGFIYADEEFESMPFFMLRAGWQHRLSARFLVDVSAEYHFVDFSPKDANTAEDLDDLVELDTIMIGASLLLDF